MARHGIRHAAKGCDFNGPRLIARPLRWLVLRRLRLLRVLRAHLTLMLVHVRRRVPAAAGRPPAGTIRLMRVYG